MPELQERCEKLLMGAGCGRNVIGHCRAVRDLALEYAGHHPFIDRDLLEAGSLLHDIGRGATHSLRHAQAGSDLLRSLGMDESLARIVECHTGAGLTPDECTLLGLFPRDCMPGTAEERIVAHADNRVAGNRRVDIDEMIAAAIHLPKRVRRRMYHLALDVEVLCG